MSSLQPVFLVCQIVLTEFFFAEPTEFGAELSEFSLLKQLSRNSVLRFLFGRTKLAQETCMYTRYEASSEISGQNFHNKTFQNKIEECVGRRCLYRKIHQKVWTKPHQIQ